MTLFAFAHSIVSLYLRAPLGALGAKLAPSAAVSKTWARAWLCGKRSASTSAAAWHHRGRKPLPRPRFAPAPDDSNSNSSSSNSGNSSSSGRRNNSTSSGAGGGGGSRADHLQPALAWAHKRMGTCTHMYVERTNRTTKPFFEGLKPGWPEVDMPPKLYTQRCCCCC